eukprot:CAMPEP_0198234150 /NCGR_PEP_ID=MMETSP1446-20131203/234_1 /TAXON_ID=1461542 ORGANISM="Unidentified sp, Strain CCMP2111" /NCGR_SAMPLE_ID=MMETSP1446 /ASSEMBLY_ACC=CAM_ASM_001112 /LENGTH=244 /DNA_ID=CAMNT_0043914881 /DNA_START=67 /DNA_END=798 /DNA_ORIENTATION=+
MFLVISSSASSSSSATLVLASPSAQRKVKVKLKVKVPEFGELSAVGDDDGLPGLSALGSDLLAGLDDVQSLHHLAEDNVGAVEPGGLGSADEELASVGVLSGVGHGQDARASVLQLEVLVLELHAVDGLATGAVVGGEVTSLAHEARDDAVERGPLEVEGLAALAGALLAGAQAAEVLDGLGNDIGAELHFDPPGGRAADGHVKVNDGVRHLLRLVAAASFLFSGRGREDRLRSAARIGGRRSG